MQGSTDTKTTYEIDLVKILNPFNPRDVERTKLTTEPTVPLRKALGIDSENHVVSVSGRVIPAEEWDRTFLLQSDTVVVCPILEGGGGGSKGVLRIVALIALAVVAPQMAAMLTGEWGVLAGVNPLLVKAGIMVLGGMLINALMPPPKPKSEGASSPSYGIDGAKNTSAEGVVVPVVYGTVRTGGNIVNNYIVNDGDTQWLHMLINCGEGPIESISDIEIDGQPITAYADVEYITKLGTPNQDVIPWFGSTIVPQNVNSKLNTAWTYKSTTSPVDMLRVDLSCPAGLFRTDDEGDTRSQSFTIRIEYSEAGANNWRSFPSYALNDGNLTVKDKKKQALRRSIQSVGLPQGAYDVRVTRIGAEQYLTDDKKVDTVFWADLNEITVEPVAYRNTAMLGLRIKLGDQISGIPTVTHINRGRKVRVWNETTGAWVVQHSSNPAWCVLDMFTNKRIGGRFPMSRFDINKWREWANFCDLNELEFNGVFDTASNVWDSAQSIFRAGHAQPIRVGTRYSVAIERAEDPVMTFSVANMLQGTFKESWLSMAERVNEIEGTYLDRDDNYRQHTLRAYDKSAVEAGTPQRSTSIDLRGVTSREQAWRDMMTMLNMNKYIQRTVQFSAPLEALACTVGNVVLVQHDMPQWGFGGRLEAGSTSSLLKLDREITMEYGKTYSALVHHSALMRYTGTVSSVSSLNATNGTTSIVLSDFDNVDRVSRCKVGGKDYRIVGIFNVSGLVWGITLDTVDPIAAGSAYELWDTDVLETRSLVNPTTISLPQVTATEVTATVPFTSAPSQYTSWLFGETTKVAKPFRIKSISGSHEYRRDLVAIEYNPSVYSELGVVPTPNYSSLDSVIQHCTIDGVTESSITYGNIYKSQLTVSFSSTQAIFKKARIYVSRDGAPFEFVGSDAYFVTLEASPGEELVFKALAEDIFGKVVADVGAPTFNYLVLGKTQAPDTVQNLAYVAGDSGWVFTFDEPAQSGWTSTLARVGSTFAGGEQVFNARATSFILPWQTQGHYEVRLRHVLNETVMSSADAVAILDVMNPAEPVIAGVDQSAGSALVRWTDARTSQPIKHYIVKVGTGTSDWNTAVEVAKASGSATSQPLAIATNGAKRVFVRAVDVAGNVSPIDSFDFEVTGGETIDTTPAPALASFTATAGFANVFIQWTEPVYTEGGGHGAVHIYGADWDTGARPTFSAAKQVGTVFAGVTTFNDPIGLGKRRVYWLKNTTLAGVEQTTPTGGTLGIDVTTTKIGNTDLGSLIVEAGNLASGAVTPSKLLSVGQGAALNDDPSCSDISAITHNGTVSAVTVTDGASGNSAFQFSSTSLTSWMFTRNFQIAGGRQYRLALYARRLSGTGNSYLRLTFKNAAGADMGFVVTAITPNIGTFEGVSTSVGTSWTRYVGTATAPAGTVSARIEITTNYPSTTGVFQIQDLRCEEYVSADLIVDGAITASKLAANSIAVGTAAIQNGAIVNAMIANATIDDAKIGNLNASKITAGTLDVGRIGANSLTVDKIDSRNLTIKNSSGTVIFGVGVALDGGTYIQSGTIGSAQIADSIQSTGYVAGTSGWKINKAGSMEINNITARGHIVATSGSFAGSLSAATGTFAGALSAATGTFSGSLTADAINAVNTINLAGQAVTIPVLGNEPWETSFDPEAWQVNGGNYVTVFSVAIQSTGSPILVIPSCEIKGPIANIQIRRNGIVLRDMVADGGYRTDNRGNQIAYIYKPNIILPVSDVPGPGVHVYSITYTGSSDFVSFRSKAIVLLETKR